MEMSEELRSALESNGWCPDAVRRTCSWGEVVSASVHHVTLRDEFGTEHYHAGPLVAIKAGGQAAIVRTH